MCTSCDQCSKASYIAQLILFTIATIQQIYTLHADYSICDCRSKNPPSSHLTVFREIPF